MTGCPTSHDEDFVFVDTEELLLRPKNSVTPLSTTPNIDIHTLSASCREVIVSVVPPREPPNGLQHIPCDIVLVIDVSASMSTAAEIPDSADGDPKESSGWSILDLVKHASRTILENLNEHDRLAIVTFSTSARVIQGLVPMTETEKAATRSRIEALTVQDSTNLWAGLREGLRLFANTSAIGNAQGMYVLTDGVPNHLNPAQGFCKKLSPMLNELKSVNGQAPTISTFGFGYYLKSSLLRSIAEVGCGSYAFIPDAAMIGTVFVHAVANLFSTYAIDTELTLECSNTLATVQVPSYYDFNTLTQRNTTTLKMGNIQYGQSRDMIVKVNDAKPSDILKASLSYQITRSDRGSVVTTQKLDSTHFLPQTATDYHVSRHEVCTFLSSFSFKSQNGEHVAFQSSRVGRDSEEELKQLMFRITSRLRRAPPSVERTDLAALLADLKSSDPADIHGQGQVSLALQTTVSLPDKGESTQDDFQKPRWLNTPAKTTMQLYGQSMFATRPQSFYTRWGQHYLPSILHAHAYQLPMTFKDPGPLRYGINSPLFIKCRDELDDAFDRLEAPKPSLTDADIGQPARRGSSTASLYSQTDTLVEHPGAIAGISTAKTENKRSRIEVYRFNRVDNPCFAGECLVRCANGVDYVRADEVRTGDMLWTATGRSRMVREVVVTRVACQRLIGLSTDSRCDSRNAETKMLWITPWHPALIDGQWMFPEHVHGGKARTIRSSHVYSFLLERDMDDVAHTVEVGGTICVTLGHGLVGRGRESDAEVSDIDVRTHGFFGDYDVVDTDLRRLDTDEHGRRISGGVGKIHNGSDAVGSHTFVRPDEAKAIESLVSGTITRARL